MGTSAPLSLGVPITGDSRRGRAVGTFSSSILAFALIPGIFVSTITAETSVETALSVARIFRRGLSRGFSTPKTIQLS